MTANVGIAERSDRLVVVLVATGLVGLGIPEAVLAVVLVLLAAASLVTVFQRVGNSAPAGPGAGLPEAGSNTRFQPRGTPGIE